jgi:hypothetical protein
MTTEDIAAIHQLIALYGHAADSDSQDLFDEVFAQDAVFESRASDRHFEGREAIKGWFALGKPPHPPAHQTTNVYVYEDAAGTVRVKSKFLAINPDTGLPRTGDYNDIVVKTDEGWRISERVSSDRFGGYVFQG